MSQCNFIKPNNEQCKFNAKYLIESHNKLFCTKHILKQANIIFEHEYTSIEDIPDIVNLTIFENSKIISAIFDKVVQIIKDTTNHEIIFDSTQDKKINHSIGFSGYIYEYPVLMHEKKYILRIATTELLREELSDAISVQAYLDRNMGDNNTIFVETIKATPELPYLIAKMVKNSFFYQLCAPYYNLRTDQLKSIDIKQIGKVLSKKIQQMHNARMVHGDISMNNIVLKEPNNILSVQFYSAMKIYFWCNINGDSIPEQSITRADILSSSTCARRLQLKIKPTRSDDYESLLYFILNLKKIILPWISKKTIKDIVDEKNKFLADPLLYIHTDDEPKKDALVEYTKLIINADYEDRPYYSRLHYLLKKISMI